MYPWLGFCAGWSALGFSSQRGTEAMVGSNVVFGCVDTPNGADYLLGGKNAASVLPAVRLSLS